MLYALGDTECCPGRLSGMGPSYGAFDRGRGVLPIHGNLAARSRVHGSEGHAHNVAWTSRLDKCISRSQEAVSELFDGHSASFRPIVACGTGVHPAISPQWPVVRSVL